MEGLSGSGNGLIGSASTLVRDVTAPIANTRTGSSMFFTLCGPRSVVAFKATFFRWLNEHANE